MLISDWSSDVGSSDLARQSLKFLDSQIEDREKALRDVEGRRAAFEARNVGLIPGGTGSPAQRVDAARAEINQIDSQLVAAQASLAATNGQQIGRAHV